MSENQNPAQPSGPPPKRTEAKETQASNPQNITPPADALPRGTDPAPQVPKPGDTAGLSRFIRNLKQKAPPGGDVNVANIGEGAQVDQIAVGRNILQAKVNIGTLVIPVRFLLALLAVGLIAAVVVWWVVTPGKMDAGTGSANIVVVEFAEQDANGKATNTGQGKYLSEWLYNRLNTELASGTVKPSPVIWDLATGFDPIHLFQKRTTTGPVRTKDDAARVAEQVGADIVVYGIVTPGEKALTFEPQFYLKDDPKSQETPELAGSQQLGKPIALGLPLTIGALESNVQPLGRIVYWLTRGLSFDLAGHFDSAYAEFLKGKPEIDSLDEGQGTEVFYYFMGTEALFLGQCETDAAKVFPAQPDHSSMEQALDAAQTAYDKAVEIQPAYARAYFGLGQVASQRGQRLMYTPDAKTFGQCRVAAVSQPAPNVPVKCPASPPTTQDAARLEQARAALMKAIDFHTQALGLIEASKDTLLTQRIETIRAVTELPLAQAFLLSGMVPDAQTHLKGGIDSLVQLGGVTKAEQDPRGAALLDFGLASGYFLQGYVRLIQNDPEGFKALLTQADSSYQMCMNIARDNPDVYLRERLGPNCTCAELDVKKALVP